jgi:hypothetical protein
MAALAHTLQHGIDNNGVQLRLHCLLKGIVNVFVVYSSREPTQYDLEVKTDHASPPAE